MLTVGTDGAEATIGVSDLFPLTQPFNVAKTISVPLFTAAPEVTVTLFVVEATGMDHAVPETDHV
jgi:hypothetical protein